jgi:hypothetical protein
MKRFPLHGKRGKLLVRDFNPGRVCVFIQGSPDSEPFFCGRVANQINNSLPADILL